MTRDWIWGWVAALPSIIVAFLAIKSIGVVSESPFIAVGLALALAATISIGMLWIKNRHSLIKINQTGGDVELIIRPIEALWRALIIFPAIFGTLTFARLIFKGQVVVEWNIGIIVIGIVSYLWSLNDTAYKKSE